MDQFRIIVVHESADDSEQLVNALRDSGHKVRYSYVDSEEAFVNNLDAQPHDFVLCRPEVGALTAKTVLSTVSHSGLDVPVVVLADKYDVATSVDFMNLGATDVVPADELAYLIIVLKREIANLQERRFRRLLELEVEEMQNRCQLLLGSSREPVAYVMDGMHIYANEAYVDKFGYEDTDEVECVPVMDMVCREHQTEFKSFLKGFLAGGSKTASFECDGIGNKEAPFPILLMLSTAEYDGEQCIQIMIGSPEKVAAITEDHRQELKAELRTQVKAEIEEEVKIELQQEMKKAIDEKVAQVGSIDDVTQVYTRQYFLQLINEMLAEDEKNDSSLFYFALDGMGSIKNKYSLAGLDDLLQQVVEYLRKNLESNMKIARISDVDFCIWLDLDDESALLGFAQKIRAGLAEELFEIDEETVKITVSIGITFIKPNIGSAYEILSRAMKAAISLQQEAEGNEVRIYRPPSDAPIENSDHNHQEVRSESLQKAIDNNLFKILFQPIISLRGEEFEFYEALLRLIDEEGKEISPEHFLGQAKSTNLAEKIDRWVILQSIKSVAARHRSGHNTKVLINLTSQSVRDSSLVPWLGVALKAAKLPKGALIFQLNEEDAHRNLKPTKEFVEKIKEFDCRFSISRYGLREKPIEIMQHVDVAFVKLDASLIRDLSNRDTIKHLTEIVSILNDDGRMAIAPFVESASVLSTLWQMGAGYIQGYYLQPPMPDMSYDFSHGE